MNNFRNNKLFKPPTLFVTQPTGIVIWGISHVGYNRPLGYTVHLHSIDIKSVIALKIFNIF